MKNKVRAHHDGDSNPRRHQSKIEPCKKPFLNIEEGAQEFRNSMDDLHMAVDQTENLVQVLTNSLACLSGIPQIGNGIAALKVVSGLEKLGTEIVQNLRISVNEIHEAVYQFNPHIDD